MGGTGTARRRRVLAVVVGVVVLVAAASYAAYRAWFEDRVDPISVDDVVGRFREEVAGANSQVPRVPTLPDPGIYRYRTTGSESIDVLGGATHPYPAETTITVTPDGCGVRLRWDALEQRRDEWRLCATADGVELQSLGLQHHEFFNQPETEELRCDRTVLLVPADGRPRARVTQSCTLASDPWLPTWDVRGTEQRVVEGTTVMVTHVVMTVTDTDEYDEHTTIDWFLDPRGLPVEVRSAKQSTSPSPIGPVRYEEAYTLELESLTSLH